MLFSIPVQIFSRQILMTVHEALLTLELIAFLPSSYSNCCEPGIILCASHLSLMQALRTPRRVFWGREWKIQRPQDRSLLSMYQTTSKPLTSKRNRVKMSHVSAQGQGSLHLSWTTEHSGLPIGAVLWNIITIFFECVDFIT